jgi:hypothetical protein
MRKELGKDEKACAVGASSQSVGFIDRKSRRELWEPFMSSVFPSGYRAALEEYIASSWNVPLWVLLLDMHLIV